MLEDQFWSGIRSTFNWNMYSPDESKEYIIQVFDDGNEKYQEYNNSWYIYGDWKGKVAVVNSSNRSITIGSISFHKLSLT